MGQSKHTVSSGMRICLFIIAVFLYGILSSLAITAQVPDTEEFDYQVYLPIISKEIAELSAVAFIVDKGVHSLWIANIDGSGEEKILDEIDELSESFTSDDEWLYRINWSPDGEWLAVNRYGGLWILTPDGDNLTELVPPDWGKGGVISSFAWSSDGTRIAFLQSFDVVTTLLGVVDLDTGEVEYLADEPMLDSARLFWSPDNLWIALSGGDKLSIFSLQTREIISNGYTCQGGHINSWSWNPQSDRLLVQDVGNGRYAHGESCIITLDGQKIGLDVGGSSDKPFWSVDWEELLVSATNFDPDDPELEEDPRILKFDRSGQYVERLGLVAKIGHLPEISPDRQSFLSWMPTEQWLTGHIQIACLNEEQTCLKKIEVDMLGRLANGDDINAMYLWDAPGENGLFLSVYNFYNWMDLNFGSIYAFNKSSGGLTQVTNVHMIRYVAVSPVH